jgi:hypothetical protein
VSARSRWARLARCEAELGGRGAVVVMQRHPCQTEGDLEGQALAALGRRWHVADQLVIIDREDACPAGPHAHAADVIIHRKTE